METFTTPVEYREVNAEFKAEFERIPYFPYGTWYGTYHTKNFMKNDNKNEKKIIS